MAKDSEPDQLVIVGIGASAGGLEAISTLITHLPQDMGAAYVIAQHMSPTHKSLLAVLVARETKLAVVELDQTPVDPAPDTIYVTPPNSDVVVQNGKLTLVEPSGHPAVPKPSADRLLNSIADECGAHCVGIILSGTGADGSYGVQAIRKEGGITIAQDPGSAKYEGMPQSAIQTGCVDIILPPDQIGLQFGRILLQPRGFVVPGEAPVPEDDYSTLLKLLRKQTRIDFEDYKENTILRRIQRRMVALDIDVFSDYVAHCTNSPEEVLALQRDLLISVTRFFRDPHQFGQLERELRRLVLGKEDERLRIWVVGCATGEEAYSIAILVAEALGGIENLDKNAVQIFATDVDENALQIARKGHYPAVALQDVPPELAETYFRTKSNGVEVIPEIRAITLFSKHNVITDPPFVKVDMVSLRNVLIYFKSELQARVLSRLHYALVGEGILFLGTSESLGDMEAYFEQLPMCDKVFVSRRSGRPYPFSVPDADHLRITPANRPTREDPRAERLKLEQDSQTFLALARSVAPNGFLATRNNDIVRVFGDMTPFMELTETTNLRMSTRILRRGLRDEAARLIAFAFKSKATREGRWHRLEGHDFNMARLVCYPIIGPTTEDQILVAVQTRMETDVPAPVESLSDKERTQYILEIETEMQSTREALQQTVEELQTSNEALQSVNEELQSTNEELQATNEELETSNEELQSTNEELITVNEEMQINATELDLVTTELTAVLSASPYPLLVLDDALIVRRASDSGLRFLSLDDLPTPGLHLSQCNLPAEFPQLSQTADLALTERRIVSVHFEVGQKTYTVAFAPFVDSLRSQLGLTITFYDSDLAASEKLIATIERLGGIGSWSFNPDSEIVSFSPGIAQSLDRTAHRIDLSEAAALLHPDDRQAACAAMHAAYVKADAFLIEARCLGPQGQVLTVQIAGTPVQNETGKVVSFVGACRDITHQQTEHLERATLEQLQTSTGLRAFTYDVARDSVFMAGDRSDLGGFGASAEPVHPLSHFLESLQRDSQKAVRAAFDTLLAEGGSWNAIVKLAGKRGAGAKFHLELRADAHADGGPDWVFGTLAPVVA